MPSAVAAGRTVSATWGLAVVAARIVSGFARTSETARVCRASVAVEIASIGGVTLTSRTRSALTASVASKSCGFAWGSSGVKQ